VSPPVSVCVISYINCIIPPSNSKYLAWLMDIEAP